MESKPELSVVMPAYNEGKSLYKNLCQVCEIIESFNSSFELVVVNDGSKDNTEEEIIRATAMDNRVRLVTYTPNKGKGNAIKEGVANAAGRYIAFLDSDLDISPSHLERYLQDMKEQNADVVIGSKMHKESQLDYPAARKVVSFCYFLVLKILFKLNVKDTQTGIKLFKSEVIKPVISLVKTKGYAYDIEILAIANQLGCRIIEEPVVINFTRQQAFGRIKIKDIIKVAEDTMNIFIGLKIKKTYDIESVRLERKLG